MEKMERKAFELTQKMRAMSLNRSVHVFKVGATLSVNFAKGHFNTGGPILGSEKEVMTFLRGVEASLTFLEDVIGED